MPKTKRNTSSKKSKDFIKPMFRSINTLYIISILALFHVIKLIINNDNNTLFLFMMTSALVYLYNTNMIYVLGIPLVVTCFLLLLSKMFSHKQTHESFINNSLDYGQIDHEQVKKLTLAYLSDPDIEGDYTRYTQNVNNKGNIAKLGDKLSASQGKTKENVEELLKYLIEINLITEDDALYDNEQVSYSKKLIDHLLDNSDKILKKAETTEVKKADSTTSTSSATSNESKKTTTSTSTTKNDSSVNETQTEEANVENIKEAVTGLLEALNNSK